MSVDFLRAVLIGFAIAAAIGPIGILCIRRSMQVGFWGGFTSGLGAALADAAYATIAAFSLVAVEVISDGLMGVGQLIGGAILIYLGGSIYCSRVDMSQSLPKFRDHLKGFGAVFLLTLSNPATIIAFLAVFAGLGVTIGTAPMDKVLLVLGIFIGSGLWWFVLAGLASRLRKRLSANILRGINRTSGMAIIGFGLFAIAAYLLQV